METGYAFAIGGLILFFGFLLYQFAIKKKKSGGGSGGGGGGKGGRPHVHKK